MDIKRVSATVTAAQRSTWPARSPVRSAAAAGPVRAPADVFGDGLAAISHDLNNDLCGIALHLELLRDRLAARPEFAEDVVTIDCARSAIQRTSQGMKRLLAHDQPRHPSDDGGPVH